MAPRQAGPRIHSRGSGLPCFALRPPGRVSRRPDPGRPASYPAWVLPARIFARARGGNRPSSATFYGIFPGDYPGGGPSVRLHRPASWRTRPRRRAISAPSPHHPPGAKPEAPRAGRTSVVGITGAFQGENSSTSFKPERRQDSGEDDTGQRISSLVRANPGESLENRPARPATIRQQFPETRDGIRKPWLVVMAGKLEPNVYRAI
jgi:hypothetical protein